MMVGGGQCLDCYDVFEDFRHTILVFFKNIALLFPFSENDFLLCRQIFVCLFFRVFSLYALKLFYLFGKLTWSGISPPPSFLSVFLYSLSLFSGSVFCLLLVPSCPQFRNRAYTGGLGLRPVRCRCWARLGLGQVHNCTMISVLSYFSLRWWTTACYDFSQPLSWAGEPHCYPCFALQAWVLSPATYGTLSV